VAQVVEHLLFWDEEVPILTKDDIMRKVNHKILCTRLCTNIEDKHKIKLARKFEVKMIKSVGNFNKLLSACQINSLKINMLMDLNNITHKVKSTGIYRIWILQTEKMI
jgi:hypothetical protein